MRIWAVGVAKSEEHLQIVKKAGLYQAQSNILLSVGSRAVWVCFQLQHLWLLSFK